MQQVYIARAFATRFHDSCVVAWQMASILKRNLYCRYC